MRQGDPEFRLGSVLATSFTGTLSERFGEAVERIPTPQRLLDWLAVYELPVQSCTVADLRTAQNLREAVHAAASAAAMGAALPLPALAIINDASAGGRAAITLTPNRDSAWQLHSRSVNDALSVIAADAIAILSGRRSGRLALCASPTCRAAFFDTSQSRSRVWCDMNTCGNRQKKARIRARQEQRGSG